MTLSVEGPSPFLSCSPRMSQKEPSRMASVWTGGSCGWGFGCPLCRLGGWKEDRRVLHLPIREAVGMVGGHAIFLQEGHSTQGVLKDNNFLTFYNALSTQPKYLIKNFV